MREYFLTRIRPLRAAIGLAGLIAALALTAETTAAQTVARTYERLIDQERAARASTATPVATLRSLARSYENMVRRYPTSSYSDNGLWQAAGLRQLAFERSSADDDRSEVLRLLAWLEREYPHSPLVKQINGVRAAVEAAPPGRSSSPAAAPAQPAPTRAGAPTGASAPVPPAPVPLPAQTPAASGPAVIRSITQTMLPKGDRIIVELSREVPFSGDRVDNPDRVFFDFSGTALSTTATEAVSAVSGSFVKSMRLGRHASGVVRVVMEMAGRPRYRTFPLYNPFRLVIDVEGDAPLPTEPGPAVNVAPLPPSPPPAVVSSITRRPAEVTTRPAVTAPALRNQPRPPPAPAPAAPAITGRGDYSLARQLGLSVSRVVIDAGHGGHDPGAQSNGVTEAELVLDLSKRVAALLRQQPGFDVVLTRDSDVYIPLEERTAIANRESADLFLSIHANAARNTTVRGIETYLLNFATNPQAEAVAARENASSAQTMGTLPAILKAIALNSKIKESRELATHVQTAMVRRLSTQSKGTRDLGVKQAPFVVLIGAEMPSVLAEVAFLTNRAEASLLKQSSYRQSIAQALCDAILRYQASLKKVTTIATGGREQ